MPWRKWIPLLRSWQGLCSPATKQNHGDIKWMHWTHQHKERRWSNLLLILSVLDRWQLTTMSHLGLCAGRSCLRDSWERNKVWKTVKELLYIWAGHLSQRKDCWRLPIRIRRALSYVRTEMDFIYTGKVTSLAGVRSGTPQPATWELKCAWKEPLMNG